MRIHKKTTCIRNYEEKTCVQEEKEGKMIGQDQNYFNHTLKGKPASIPDIETQRIESDSSTLCTQPQIKNKEHPQWSRQFCYGEKLPMDWGYHNRLNDTRNQSFPICKSNKDI